MPRDQRESDGTGQRDESTTDDRQSGGQWIANAGVRLGLTLVGFVLLLFALVQASESRCSMRLVTR